MKWIRPGVVQVDELTGFLMVIGQPITQELLGLERESASRFRGDGGFLPRS
jgi:hypothetical protein